MSCVLSTSSCHLRLSQHTEAPPRPPVWATADRLSWEAGEEGDITSQVSILFPPTEPDPEVSILHVGSALDPPLAEVREKEADAQPSGHMGGSTIKRKPCVPPRL